ncbi:hypothetical protein L1987_49459 [Smallanthus sonchifolius]|uniref:Uncharacterized protein n=1 Tax=Smallanthus sonchifolius TaxID=185202 RepID=A0ACB9FVU6_9ASTR|nr:hypothetical protein L1987_49459 [Smallanthus sonchifolius]
MFPQSLKQLHCFTSTKNLKAKVLKTMVNTEDICIDFEKSDVLIVDGKQNDWDALLNKNQVHIIVDNMEITNGNIINLRAASSAALLLLPSKFTECLGSISGDVWYLGVAKSSIVDPNVEEGKGKNVLQSRSGHFFVPPAVDSVQVVDHTSHDFKKEDATVFVTDE